MEGNGVRAGDAVPLLLLGDGTIFIARRAAENGIPVPAFHYLFKIVGAVSGRVETAE